MKIAVLPFNAGPGTEPALARQSSGFIGEVVRQASDHDINPVSYLGRTEEEGAPRFAHFNPSESLNETEMLADFFEKSGVDMVVDGLLTENENGTGTVVVRWSRKDDPGAKTNEYTYLPGGMLKALRSIIEDFSGSVGGVIGEGLETDQALFGTGSADAFRKFLIGYDAAQYVERSQGLVLKSFDPHPALTSLVEAIEIDSDWEAPALTLMEFSRLCTLYRLGNGPMIEKNLRRLVEADPKDARAWFALGNLLTATDKHTEAAEAFEKAHVADPKEPAILIRLAQEQLALNMPVNAERNLRKAADIEEGEMPARDLLSMVLVQTGRGHEVPELWHEAMRKFPQNGAAHAKHAASLYNANKKEQAMKAFEDALTTLEDPTFVKRFFAPVLVKEENLDRAMDLYEDVLDVAPTDVTVLGEYAQTLSAAGRDFEVPKVLRDILAANPDPNTRAMAQAWLIELEQPQRIEAIKDATERAEKGDFEGALAQLAPLRAWLADYWKLWALLASVHNNLKQFDEAERAARKTLEQYPACEPVYGELCTALSGLGRDEEAYHLMKVALGNMPNSLLIAINYAMAAKRTGDREEALHVARQIRQATNNAENLRSVLDEIES